MLVSSKIRRLITEEYNAIDNCKSTNNKFQQSVLILKKSTKSNKNKSESRETSSYLSLRLMRIIYSMFASSEVSKRSKRFEILNDSASRRLLLVFLQSLSKKRRVSCSIINDLTNTSRSIFLQTKTNT